MKSFFFLNLIRISLTVTCVHGLLSFHCVPLRRVWLSLVYNYPLSSQSNQLGPLSLAFPSPTKLKKYNGWLSCFWAAPKFVNEIVIKCWAHSSAHLPHCNLYSHATHSWNPLDRTFIIVSAFLVLDEAMWACISRQVSFFLRFCIWMGVFLCNCHSVYLSPLQSDRKRVLVSIKETNRKYAVAIWNLIWPWNYYLFLLLTVR